MVAITKSRRERLIRLSPVVSFIFLLAVIFFGREVSSGLIVPVEARSPSPSTPKVSDSPPTLRKGSVLVAAGDISCGNGEGSRPCQQLSNTGLIYKLQPDTVLSLSDLEDSGSEIDGNQSKGYYSFDLGTWHLIALNSNCARVGGCSYDSPQGRFLRQDLADHPGLCTLAFWHHPRFSSGQSGNNTSLQTFWTILSRAGAEIVLSGHDHNYERFAPLDLNGEPDPKNGLREFVVGTGGKSLSQFNVVRDYSEARNARTFGVLRLNLTPGSYEWAFIAASSFGYADSGRGQCH